MLYSCTHMAMVGVKGLTVGLGLIEQFRTRLSLVVAASGGHMERTTLTNILGATRAQYIIVLVLCCRHKELVQQK